MKYYGLKSPYLQDVVPHPDYVPEVTALHAKVQKRKLSKPAKKPKKHKKPEVVNGRSIATAMESHIKHLSKSSRLVIPNTASRVVNRYPDRSIIQELRQLDQDYSGYLLGYPHHSKGELWLKYCLDSLEIPYQTEVTIAGCINPKTGAALRFDFLVDSDLLIEYDGSYHRTETDYFNTNLKDVVYRDAAKDAFIAQRFRQRPHYYLFRLYASSFNALVNQLAPVIQSDVVFSSYKTNRIPEYTFDI